MSTKAKRVECVKGAETIVNSPFMKYYETIAQLLTNETDGQGLVDVKMAVKLHMHQPLQVQNVDLLMESSEPPLKVGLCTENIYNTLKKGRFI